MTLTWIVNDVDVVNVGVDQVINAVVVTFKDEPEVFYFYSYEKDTKQIIQLDVEHEEETIPSLKHKKD